METLSAGGAPACHNAATTAPANAPSPLQTISDAPASRDMSNACASSTAVESAAPNIPAAITRADLLRHATEWYARKPMGMYSSRFSSTSRNDPGACGTAQKSPKCGDVVNANGKNEP